jgi:hypothetical protein
VSTTSIGNQEARRCEARTTSPALWVAFESRGRSGRKWEAEFRLGSAEENAIKALEVCWTDNARILASLVLS